MQDAVLEVLKQAARLNKQILIEQTESIKHKHRSTRYIDLYLLATESSNE